MRSSTASRLAEPFASPLILADDSNGDKG